MIILGIDPGPVETAWVEYDTEKKIPQAFSKDENNVFLAKRVLNTHVCNSEKMFIEMIASYGMPVGKDVFQTCVWIGRFIQRWMADYTEEQWEMVYRKDVKMHLCNTNRAKDSNVRQAISDRYGGTVQKAKGTKKTPGPLYGIKSDIWAALGVAITAAETKL